MLTHDTKLTVILFFLLLFRNFPTAKSEKLKKAFVDGYDYQFNIFVELENAKQAKDAKDLLSKSFEGKPIAVGLALSQVCY